MNFTGFDWDDGNRAKCRKHGVSTEIIEEMFTRALAILPDVVHSQTERRFRAIGRSESGRFVFVVFTIRRGKLIRPISARYMHAKEVSSYEKDNPDF